MHRSTPILVATLALNAALVAYYAFGQKPAIAAETPRARPAAPTRPAAKPAVAGKGLDLGAEAWRSLAATDQVGLIARLREAGVPASILFGIADGLVSIELGPKLQATVGGAVDTSYWKQDPLQAIISDQKRLSAYNAVLSEGTARIRELVGDDFSARKVTPDRAAENRRAYGDLSDEKLVQYFKINDDYTVKLMQATLSAGLSPTPAERQGLEQIRLDQRAALEAAFTPAEIDGIDLRSGTAASAVRLQIAAFNPSEEEFKALVHAQQAFEKLYPAGTPEQALARANHRNDLYALQAAAVGPDRATDLELSRNEGSVQLARVASRLALPSTAVHESLTVQKAAQGRAAEIKADAALDPATRNQQLSSLAADTGRQLSTLLGDTAYEAYRQAGGAWLAALAAPPRPAPPAPAAR